MQQSPTDPILPKPVPPKHQSVHLSNAENISHWPVLQEHCVHVPLTLYQLVVGSSVPVAPLCLPPYDMFALPSTGAQCHCSGCLGLRLESHCVTGAYFLESKPLSVTLNCISDLQNIFNSRLLSGHQDMVESCLIPIK